MADYDVIVVGAGNNGLAAAITLAKKGLKVLSLEKNGHVGGIASTVEYFKGFKHDIGAAYLFPLAGQIIEDLELEKYNPGFVDTPIMSINIGTPDEKPVVLYRDQVETMNHIRENHGEDALLGLAGVFEYCAGPAEALDRFTPLSRPKSLGEIIDSAADIQTQDKLRRCYLGSAMDVISQFFPDPNKYKQIQAFLAFMAIQSSYRGPYTPGSALNMVYGLANPGGGQLMHRVKGGMGMLMEGLRRSLEEKGGEIKLASPVKRIMVQNGKAIGVELKNNEKITATAVISNLDANATFIGMVGEENLPVNFVQMVRAIDHRCAYIQILLTLKELPEFTGNYAFMNDNDLFKQSMGVYESPQHLELCWDECKWGKVPENPAFGLSIPSILDHEMAPSGYHTAAIYSYYFPCTAPREQHGRLKNVMAERVIDKMNRYAPNFKDAIINKAVFAPLHFEAMFGCTDGDYMHGLPHPDQMLSFRPVVGWAEYKTPIENLYLCSSACHPGPGVTFMPGYNSAHEVLKNWNP